MKKLLLVFLALLFALPVSGLGDSIFDREWLDVSFVHKTEYTLPETEDLPYLYACSFGTLHIPKGVADVPVLDHTTVEAYQVPQDHPLFQTVDGSLYSKDGKTLLAYPNARKNSHFDVPFGVESIEEYAFAENDYLQSVSLPLTLKTLRRGSFYHCGGLISINIPLSVTEIGPYAFADCVNLEKVSMSPALEEKVRAGVKQETSFGETPVSFARVFDNCPKLENSLWYGDEGVLPGEAYYSESEKSLWLIASPKSVNEKIRLYAQPDDTSEVLLQLACGETICSANIYHPDYYVVDDPSGPYAYSRLAYIKKSDVVIAPEETLFAIASVYPKNEQVPVTYHRWENNKTVPVTQPFGAFLQYVQSEISSDDYPVSPEELTISHGVYSSAYSDRNMCGEAWIDLVEEGMVMESCVFFLSDAILTREKTGDSKTLGLVISDAPENRVHLRSKASKSSDSLGRYFTGTQVEILGEQGDFYEVNVNGLTHGFMMKEFVRIVPQEE